MVSHYCAEMRILQNDRNHCFATERKAKETARNCWELSTRLKALLHHHYNSKYKRAKKEKKEEIKTKPSMTGNIKPLPSAQGTSEE